MYQHVPATLLRTSGDSMVFQGPAWHEQVPHLPRRWPWAKARTWSTKELPRRSRGPKNDGGTSEDTSFEAVITCDNYFCELC